MWIAILLIAANIIIILSIIYVVGCADSASKFQIPNFEHEDTQTELVD